MRFVPLPGIEDFWEKEQYAWGFMKALLQAIGALLSADPIRVSGGQLAVPISHQERENAIANELANLPPYYVKSKILTPEGMTERVFTTIPPLLSQSNLRFSPVGRPRQIVEDEITNRQAGTTHLQDDEAEPPEQFEDAPPPDPW